METWLEIPGFEGLYMVSNLGRVRTARRRHSIPFNYILSPNVDRFGYHRYHLTDKNGHRRGAQSHCLVMLAFVGKKPEDCEVNHKNMNRGDNRLENLEYITHEKNIEHAIKNGDRRIRIPRGVNTGSAKLTDDQVIEIRDCAARGETRRSIGDRYGVSHVAVTQVVNRKTWAHV
jgi:hypothetical protein